MSMERTKSASGGDNFLAQLNGTDLVIRAAARDVGSVSLSAYDTPIRYCSGLLLARLGADAPTSRWSSRALALRHLLAGKFLFQAMFGALLQFISVAVGGSVWRLKLLAAILHPVITAGGVPLSASLLDWYPAGPRLAAVLLISGSAGYAVVIGIALLRTSAASATGRLL